MNRKLITEDWDEVETPKKGRPQQPRGPEPEWRKAERYFKQYRDTKKTIPLRPQYGKAHT